VGRARTLVLVVVALVLGSLVPLVPHYYIQPQQHEVGGVTLVTTYQGAEDGRYVRLPLAGVPTFRSYEELLEYVQRALRMYTSVASGLTPTYGLVVELVGEVVTLHTLRAVAPVATPAPTYAKSEVRYSRTNVQVEGVDELDVVKTDGRLIAVASGRVVYLVDASSKEVVGRLEFSGGVAGLFLSGGRLAVVVQDVYPPLRLVLPELVAVPIPAGTPNTTVVVVDVGNASKPEVLLRVQVTGGLVGSRLLNGYVYLVLSQPLTGGTLPVVNGNPVAVESVGVVEEVPESYTNILVVDLSTLRYTVYSFLTGPGSWVYMSPSRLYVAHTSRPSIYRAYTRFLEVVSRYVPAGVASEVGRYLSVGDVAKAMESLRGYLSSLDENSLENLVARVNEELSKQVAVDETTFYVFGVSGLSLEFLRSFKVPGTVLDQFSMEELGRYFVVSTTVTPLVVKAYLVRVWPATPPRGGGAVTVVNYYRGTTTTVTVALGTGGGTGEVAPWVGVAVEPAGETENCVFTVDLDSGRVAGSLRGLATGERIYAARLIGSTLYLVTFRQVDPLFAIDLSNPEEPRVLGFLKVPGFSEYLHPVAPGRLLGVGVEDGYLKVSLYDVEDPGRMEEVSKVLISCSHSPVLADHKAITVDHEYSYVYLPITSYCTYPPAGGLAVLKFGRDRLEFVRLLEHPNAIRSLYIGRELYSISASEVRVYTLPELEYLTSIELS
jgi:uncharacterized secreted protein with C-terminal beta-propeller domain